MDEKYDSFLLLAYNDNAHAYAFEHNNEILYLEDIPDNYPSTNIIRTNLKSLKTIVRRLKRLNWVIHIDRTSEQPHWGTPQPLGKW